MSVIARVCECRTSSMALRDGRARFQTIAFWLEVETTQWEWDACGDHCTSATDHAVRCGRKRGGS